MNIKDRITIVSAISNHDESTGGAVDLVSAALIIADIRNLTITSDMPKEDRLKLMPYITQDGEDRDYGDDQYIKNMQNGCMVGYKYFNFNNNIDINKNTNINNNANILTTDYVNNSINSNNNNNNDDINNNNNNDSNNNNDNKNKSFNKINNSGSSVITIAVKGCAAGTISITTDTDYADKKLSDYSICGKKKINISDDDKLLLQQKFDKMYVTKDLYRIYCQLLEECGLDPLSGAEYERRKIPYEDVFPMLYLKYRLEGGNHSHKNIKHLVIDEMQDYSYLQYVLLAKMFSCNMTILGDKAQTIAGKQQDVLTFLPKIFGKKVKRIVMNKSYRNTSEIAEYAKSVGGSKDIQYVARHGKAVERHTIKTLEKTCKEISGKLKLREEEYETAAILTMTEKEAEHIQEIMHKLGAEAHYINRDSAQFKKGLTVTTYYLAKGLEFDQVFVVGGDRNNKMYQGYQYICATRALHELYVYDA